jgi:transposase-like protein
MSHMGALGSGLELFKGRQFDQEIIVLCVRWCLTYKLSSRDVVEIDAIQCSSSARQVRYEPTRGGRLQ